jgi:hypothetical protein
MMYLGNDLIDSVTLEDEKVRIPGYLGEFKRQMKIKHEELLVQSETRPEFLVTIIAPPVIETKIGSS